MNDERMPRWLGPLALGSIVAFVIGMFALSQNEPGNNAPAAQVVTYFRDHGTRETWSIYVVGVGLVLLAFYISGLRTVLRDINPGHSWLGTAGFVGGILFLAGFGVVGVYRLVLIEAARNNHTALAGDLNFFINVAPVLVFLGLAVMGLGFGAAVLTSDAVPSWIGALGIVIGLTSLLGPAAFFGVLATPIWFAILGFTLAMRAAPHERAATESGTGRMGRLIPRHHH